MRTVLFVLGWVSLSLGLIGAFLPVLPTTPFLILSAYLFSKSSPRFHAWLLELPLAGDAVRDWDKNKVIRPRAKILCALMMIFSTYLMFTFAKVHIALKLIVTFLLLGVGIFVMTRNSSSK